MLKDSNKIRQFWEELKRRRVIHVVTVYASASFVIIDLVGNLKEPLNLPPVLPIILIIVLAVGFPLAVVLSWIYDLTSEGIEKTKPLDEIRDAEKPAIPNAWKIATYISFALIIGLVTFNIIGGTKLARAGEIQTLMILPIDNYTGDDRLDELISGMHSVLISDVGRISALNVISKITSVACADKPAEQIAAEQGVDVIVKPIFMCLADSVCFQMRAVTSEGEEIWISDFREPKSQLPNLTNSITKEIAEEVNVKLTANEEHMLAESRTADPDAYEAWVKGHQYWDELNKKDLELARMYFERAIEIDPDWAPPYAGLAITWGALMSFANVPDSIGQPKQDEYLNKALELDPNDAYVQFVVAAHAVWTEWNWEKGERAFVASLKSYPNGSRCRIYYAHLLSILRRSEEALHQAKLAVELDPLNPLIAGLYHNVLFYNGECLEALNYLETALSKYPDHIFLAAGKFREIYVCLGDYEKAFDVWSQNPDWERFGVAEVLKRTFHEKGWMAFLEELTRINIEIMSEEIQFPPTFFFDRYLALGNYDRAMDYLEIAYDDHSQRKDIGLPYQSVKGVYDKMKDNPRYIALLKKMNLPTSDD